MFLDLNPRTAASSSWKRIGRMDVGKIFQFANRSPYQNFTLKFLPLSDRNTLDFLLGLQLRSCKCCGRGPLTVDLPHTLDIHRPIAFWAVVFGI